MRPPDRSPAPARRLVPQPQPRSSRDRTPDAPRCCCSSSPDCRLRLRPRHAALRVPGVVPAAPAPPRLTRPPCAAPARLPRAPSVAPRSLLPGTLGGSARPAPWITGPRASASSSGSSRPWAAAAGPVRPREVSAGGEGPGGWGPGSGRCRPGTPGGAGASSALGRGLEVGSEAAQKECVCMGGAASQVSTLWGSVVASVKEVGGAMRINGGVCWESTGHTVGGEGRLGGLRPGRLRTRTACGQRRFPVSAGPLATHPPPAPEQKA